MSASQGKENRPKSARKPRRELLGEPPESPGGAADDDSSGLSEIMRKALSMGLSGFFVTESAIRRALGDTLPKDWVDFAVDQSERTRSELIERMSFEMGRSIENIDLAAIAEQLLEGRTLEIKAEIRLSPRNETDERRPASDRTAGTRLRVSVAEDDSES